MVRETSGFFVGAVWAMYQMLDSEKIHRKEGPPNSFLWSIAIAFPTGLNLSGPSLTLDTAVLPA